MAVYKRNYKPYTGSLTAQWSRFLVIPRYAYQDLFASKFITAFFVACFVPAFIAGLFIYVRYNASAVTKLALPLDDLLPINNTFFLWLLFCQGLMAFFMTVLAGPGLVSPDLSNNALPLYLCRPFNRVDYVLGKMSVLLILLSAITWAPLLFLYFFNASLAGSDWLWNNLYLAVAIFLGSLIWILLISLISLAISAWVRWKPIAGMLMFGIMFIASVFGNIVYHILDLRWGKWLDLQELIWTVWTWLFNYKDDTSVPVTEAWIFLLLFCAFSLFILNRKIKAYEVVR